MDEVIYSEKLPNSRDITLRLRGRGDIQMYAEDSGETVKEVWRGSDYEFWVDVPASQLKKIAFALLKERYAGNAKAVDEFTEFCKKHSIQHQWASYTSTDFD